jgi:hypothetical protein
MIRYGLAPLFTGGTSRVCGVPAGSAAWTPKTAIDTTAVAANEHLAKADIDIAALP